MTGKKLEEEIKKIKIKIKIRSTEIHMDDQSDGQGASVPDGKYLRSIYQSTWMVPSPTKSLGGG